VNAIWLLPFYPSPRRDDGYDIADYRNVHPDYGTISDVKRFIVEAHEARHSGHHRTGHQPHLGPAPVVPARPPQRSPARIIATSTSGPTRPEIRRHADHLHRYRAVELDLGSGGRRSTTGTASSRTSPI
jgi:hypothetical protein